MMLPLGTGVAAAGGGDGVQVGGCQKVLEVSSPFEQVGPIDASRALSYWGKNAS